MCGFPHHAFSNYLGEIVEARTAGGGGGTIGRSFGGQGHGGRDVVRVVTPGTVLEEELLSAKENNFWRRCGRPRERGGSGLVWADMSTGELRYTFSWRGRRAFPLGRRAGPHRAPGNSLAGRRCGSPGAHGDAGSLRGIFGRGVGPTSRDLFGATGNGGVWAWGWGIRPGRPWRRSCPTWKKTNPRRWGRSGRPGRTTGMNSCCWTKAPFDGWTFAGTRGADGGGPTCLWNLNRPNRHGHGRPAVEILAASAVDGSRRHRARQDRWNSF
jgi:hypothetical protein